MNTLLQDRSHYAQSLMQEKTGNCINPHRLTEFPLLITYSFYLSGSAAGLFLKITEALLLYLRMHRGTRLSAYQVCIGILQVPRLNASYGALKLGYVSPYSSV